MRFIQRNLFGAALVAFIVAGISACGNGIEKPSPIPTTSGQSCPAVITGNANAVNCGTGNSVTQNPAPTVTPTPSTALSCSKGIPRYEQNLIIAERDIPANQAMASYMLALSAALKRDGFQVSIGGTLPADELAVKISDAFSETYDVWRADNTPQVLYQETCTPARF